MRLEHTLEVQYYVTTHEVRHSFYNTIHSTVNSPIIPLQGLMCNIQDKSKNNNRFTMKIAYFKLLFSQSESLSLGNPSHKQWAFTLPPITYM